MISETISNLKNSGLIKQDDIVIACMDYMADNGGPINSNMTALTIGHYILVANKDGIRLFDINKKTDEYSGICISYKNEKVIKTSISGLFGNLIIGLKTTSGYSSYSASKKFKDYSQKEDLAKLKDFLKHDFK